MFTRKQRFLPAAVGSVRNVLLCFIAAIAVIYLALGNSEITENPNEAALVLYALHSCDIPKNSSQWGNSIMFLLRGGLVEQSARFGRVDYVLVFSRADSRRVRMVHQHENIRVFEVPQFFADLQSFGCLASALIDENWFESYSHFLWLNSGTRGPYFDVAGWSHVAAQFPRDRAAYFNWVDVTSGAVPGFDKQRVHSAFVVTPSVSWEYAFHAQSYFLTMPPAAAKMLLAHYADPLPRSKSDAILRLEVGATTKLTAFGCAIFDLNRRRFVLGTDKDTLLGAANPYLRDGFVDPYQGLFVKYRAELAPPLLKGKVMLHETRVGLPTSQGEFFTALQQKLQTTADVTNWCTSVPTDGFIISFDDCALVVSNPLL